MPPSKRLKRSPSIDENPEPGSTVPDPSSTIEPPKVAGQASSTPIGQAEAVNVSNGPHKPLTERKSWYVGSWPRTPKKAAPITQLATDTISVGGEVLAKTGERAKSIAGSLRGSSRPPSIYMSPGVSTRSLPATASTSRVSVSMPKSGLTSSCDDMDVDSTKRKPQSDKPEASPPEVKDTNASEAQAPTGPPSRIETPVSGWRGWIPSYRYGAEQPAPSQIPPDKGLGKEETPGGLGTKQDPQQEPPNTTDTGQSSANVPKDTPQSPTEDIKAPVQALPTRPRSWFGIWSGEAETKGQSNSVKPQEGVEPDQTKPSDTSDTAQGQDPRAENKAQTVVNQPASDATVEVQTQNASGQNSSTSWLFWPRNAPVTATKLSESISEDEPASSNLAKPDPGGQPEVRPQASNIPSSSRKRERPTSVEIPAGTEEDTISKKTPDGKTSASAAIDVLPKIKDDKQTPRKQQSTNLLLPSLKQTLRAAEHPGLLSRLASYFYSSKPPPARHVDLISNPPKIRHALAIGVHGYFPAPFLRSVIGQPRGTSIRFATNAADAIAEWSRKHGCSPDIEKIALEGEGKIEERVELLWQLLLRHLQKVREADFILVACHSQGVPVAVQLIAKLIALGCCMPTAKVGICAMAGVNQGPFAEYKSRWIGGSAGELFDFASPNSKVSMDYEVALNTVLRAGVKIVLVGSIDDQLVSMESATFGNAEHPCLFRTVFINSQVHAPTFLVHLVGFALKLRNLGIPDHGLVRELSNSLSGSFTGDGHSRLYEDFQLYDTTIEFAMETTPYTDVPLVLKKTPSVSSQNPYILPFAMRGVLEEDFVKSELHSEMLELLKQFDDWKPTTKPLKDVKFRLEGVRSKI